MYTIQVDFEVFKELTYRRTSEAETENDVIRRLLGLSQSTSRPEPVNNAAATGRKPWAPKGIHFPHGTEFRAHFKGRQYTAIVDDGALVVHEKRFISPSAAAREITKNSVNGWTFWECRLPDSTRWKLMANMR